MQCGCAPQGQATRVTLDSSCEVEGVGCGRKWERVSESAILDNREARAYYEQYRSWQGSSRKRAKPLVVVSPAQPSAVKLGRDEQRVHQRYLRMSKEALVERLIVAERTLAEQRERWLTQQDEALTWRLRAEAAKARLKEGRNR